jgi:molecular chaperone Hsp33
MEHYLTTSEQLASRLVLATDAGRARGLLVQRLPVNDAAEGSAIDDTWTRASDLLAHIDPATLFAPGSPEALIAAFLTQDDVRVFAPKAVSFHCSCSLERVERALRIAGKAEVESILAERGGVLVTCEFCNHDYSFGPSEARAIFAADAPRVHH